MNPCILYIYYLCVYYDNTGIKFFFDAEDTGAKAGQTHNLDGCTPTTTTISAATTDTKTPALQYDYARTGPVSVRYVFNSHYLNQLIRSCMQNFSIRYNLD